MTSISAPPFTDGRNEAYTAPARPRPLHDPLLRALEGVDMASLTGPLGDRIEAAGATFSTEPLAVCPVPRLIENSEWTALSAALAQRVHALLSAFVTDAYGRRSIVAAEIVPAGVIDDAQGYEPELRRRWPHRRARLGVVGLELVRDRDGELRTLEDNTRTPSGFAYAVAARDAVTATLDALAPTLGGTTPAPIPLEPAMVAALRATLWDATAAIGRGAAGDASAAPNVVVLTSGPGSAAFLENATAARWLAAPLGTLAQLQRRGDELWLRAGEADPACRVEAAVRRPGAGIEYVAQRTVALSLHPTVVGGRLVERHIDLRPFLFATCDGVMVMPGGLTRVAWDAGALVVNSSQDGGAKDTWELR